MAKIVVITGGSAGVGRATATEFARNGYDVAILARDPERLERAAAELRQHGVRALPIPTDVAQVHGTMAALKRMRTRNKGTIVHVGSALAYRSVPLQSIYCGSKAAIRGFVDALRSELIHDRLDINITNVDLPAVNTPQFDWASNKMGLRAMPVPPIYQPEVPARAIFFAATHKRREIWVGYPTVQAILANRIAPALIDRYLASAGYSGQLTKEPLPPDAPANLFEPVPGRYGAHGRFDSQARSGSWEMFTDRHRTAFWAAAAVGAVAAVHQLARRLKI